MSFLQHNLLRLAGANLVMVLLFTQPRAMAQNQVLPTVHPATQVKPSPVESFRLMLAMSPEEQKKYLAPRPPEIRQRLLDKLAEYQLLTAEEQELKLRGTELRWYVRPLMNLPPTNREAQLMTIPPGLRPQAAARIEEWDRMPARAQRTLMVHPEAIAYFTRWETIPNPPRPPSPADLLRRKMNDSLKRLVALPRAEREKTLEALPDEAERRQMQQTMQMFEKLKPGQRERCIQSFAAFASLSEAERQDFLKSAERWSQMSPTDREAWRELVERAPIMPPLLAPISPRPSGSPSPSKTNAG